MMFAFNDASGHSKVLIKELLYSSRIDSFCQIAIDAY